MYGKNYKRLAKGYLNHDLWFPGQANQKNEVFDAKSGSLNIIFGNCSFVTGFRYVRTFSKIKSLDYLTIRGSCESQNSKKLTEFVLFDLKSSFVSWFKSKCCKNELLCTPDIASREKLQIIWLSIQISFGEPGGKNWCFLVNLTILNLQLQTVGLMLLQYDIRVDRNVFLTPSRW